MTRKVSTSGPLAMAACSLLTLGLAGPAAAEPFVGFGIGTAAVELNDFDEDDGAVKVFAGYIFDLPAVDFSVEGGYVDFGSPESDAGELAIEGFDAFAIVGIDFGPVGVFAKAGLILWDADAMAGSLSYSDDGNDTAYGAGLRFNVKSVEIRAEYELFDVEVFDDLSLISASFVWRF